ncbi:MAG: hypothetical protein PVJ57_05120 [Phycisphaerae bacterium]|jgi:hypothetical protein
MASEDDGSGSDGGAPLDQDGRLAEDRRCSRCGYNLRGLEPAGDCPECAQPVRESLVSNQLRYADRRWLRKVRLGLLLLLVAAVSFFACVLAMALALFMAVVTRSLSLDLFVAWVAIVCGVGSAVLAFCGMLLFTACEPNEREGQPARTRRWARILTCGLAVIGVVVILLDRGALGPVGSLGTLVADAAALLVGLATIGAASVHMGYLIKRGDAEGDSLAGSVVALVVAAGVLLGICFAVSPDRGPSDWVFVLALALLVGLMPPTAGVLFLVMLQAYRVVDQAWRDDPVRYGRTPPAG